MQVTQLAREATLLVESELETANLDGRSFSGEADFTALLEEDLTNALPAMTFDDVASRPRSQKEILGFSDQFQLVVDNLVFSKVVAPGLEDTAVTPIEAGGENPIIRDQWTQTGELPSAPNRTPASSQQRLSSVLPIDAAVTAPDISQSSVDEKIVGSPAPLIASNLSRGDRNLAWASGTDAVSKNIGKPIVAENPPILAEGNDAAPRTTRNPPDLKSQALNRADPFSLPAIQADDRQAVFLPQGGNDAPLTVRMRQVVEPPLVPQQRASTTEGSERDNSARERLVAPDNLSTSNGKENWSSQKSFAISQSTLIDRGAISKAEFQIDQGPPASGMVQGSSVGEDEKTSVGTLRSDEVFSVRRVGGVQDDQKAHTFSQLTPKSIELDRTQEKPSTQEVVLAPKVVQAELHKPSNAMTGPILTASAAYEQPHDLSSPKAFISEKSNLPAFEQPNGSLAIMGDLKSVADFKGVELSAAKFDPPKAVVPQLSEAVRAASNGVIEVKLAPEELGRVKLSLAPTEAGLAVTIVAERAETIDLIRRNIELFANDLRQLGHQNLSFQFGHSGRQAGSNANPKDQNELGDQLRTEQPEISPTPISQTKMVDGQLDLRI